MCFKFSFSKLFLFQNAKIIVDLVNDTETVIINKIEAKYNSRTAKMDFQFNFLKRVGISIRGFKLVINVGNKIYGIKNATAVMALKFSFENFQSIIGGAERLCQVLLGFTEYALNVVFQEVKQEEVKQNAKSNMER